MQSFADKNTGTLNKYLSEFYSDDNFKPILSKILPKMEEPCCAMLVGQAKNGNLPRHIRRALKLGFKEKNIYIFEKERKTYRSLVREAAILGLKINIIFCKNMYEAMEKINVNWAYVEGDGTGSFGTYDFEAISLFKKLKVVAWVIVGSARGKSLNYEQEIKKHGYRKTRDRKNKLRHDLIRLAPKIIEKKTKSSYVTEFFTYKGLCSMYQINGIAKEYA